MIEAQVTDLLGETHGRIAAAAVASIEDVRRAPPLVGFSAPMREENRALKAFLNDNLYRHYQVLRMTNKARRIITDLFTAFMAEPRLLPPQYQQRAQMESASDPLVRDPKARAVADYIAGMTDRYAIKEHRRLFAVGDN
jgi:dGTPase